MTQDGLTSDSKNPIVRKQRSVPSIGILVAIAIFVIVTGIAGGFWWRIHSRLALIAEIEAAGGRVDTVPTTHDWLRDWLGRERTRAFEDGSVIVWPNATDHSFRRIGSLRSADKVVLEKAKLTSMGYRSLQSLKGLMALQVSNTTLLDADVQQLADLPGIEYLFMNGSTFSDFGLRSLKRMNFLFCLDLTRTSITNAGVRDLGDVKSLSHLYLEETNVTDEGIRHLAKVPTLETLNVRNTKVTPGGFLSPGGFPSLSELMLDGAVVTDESLLDLVHLPSLRTVSVSDTDVTEGGVERFWDMRSDIQVLGAKP